MLFIVRLYFSMIFFKGEILHGKQLNTIILIINTSFEVRKMQDKWQFSAEDKTRDATFINSFLSK